MRDECEHATGCYTDDGWREVAITGYATIDDGPQEAGSDEP